MNRREYLKAISILGAGILSAPYLKASEPFLNPELKASMFGSDFLWGAATAAYQIEGARNVDGKGESIWDKFSHTKGKIKTGETGDEACDFYHHFEQDILLMKSMNLKVFRFSISWPRIFPNGTGEINQAGVDFYHKVIDCCIKNGIQPWITLYHWDLPQKLEDKGGWTNREVIKWFTEYADFVTKAYGLKVKNWMVLNEPLSYTAVGYLFGIHAPGHKGLKRFFPAAHHTTICQAEGGRIIRRNVKDANIGTTFSCSYIEGIKNKPKHLKSVKRFDAFVNRLFLEPALGMGYPVNDLPVLKKIEKYMLPGDTEKMKFDFDFIGLQNYTREIVKGNALIPYLHGLPVPAKKRGAEITENGWEVYPEGIYHLLKKYAAYPNMPKIIITENGAAFEDTVEDGKIQDIKRTDFLKKYLEQVLKAKNEGVNVGGYFCWSFMDNFEWAEGFKPRFGLVHIDFKTQQRIVKDSGLWYKDFLGK